MQLATDSPDFKPETITIDHLKAAADKASAAVADVVSAKSALWKAQAAADALEAEHIKLIQQFYHQPPVLEVVS